jgi:hypothetical protein
VSLNPSADPTMETMILGQVLEQEVVLKDASVVAGTEESGIRTFLTLAWAGNDRRMGDASLDPWVPQHGSWNGSAC